MEVRLLNLPVQSTFFKCVYVTKSKDTDEAAHAPECHGTFLSEFAELHSPWIHKDHFDIKNNKEHRNEVEFNTKAGRPISDRQHTAFVGTVLCFVLSPFLAKYDTHEEHRCAEANSNKRLHYNGEIILKHSRRCKIR